MLGVGAFNLVRREALEVLGGWEPQRLAVIEDVTLGRRMKAAGLRQRVAFGPDLVLVHWAKGARGIVRGLTKNLFAAVNFRPLLMLGVCGAMLVLFLAPLAGLAWWPTVLPALIDALLHRSVLSHHERAQPHRCALWMAVSRRRVRDGVGDGSLDAFGGGAARRDVARYVLSAARAANAQQSVAVGAERGTGSARGGEGKAERWRRACWRCGPRCVRGSARRSAERSGGRLRCAVHAEHLEQQFGGLAGRREI